MPRPKRASASRTRRPRRSILGRHRSFARGRGSGAHTCACSSRNRPLADTTRHGLALGVDRAEGLLVGVPPTRGERRSRRAHVGARLRPIENDRARAIRCRGTSLPQRQPRGPLSGYRLATTTTTSRNRAARSFVGARPCPNDNDHPQPNPPVIRRGTALSETTTITRNRTACSLSGYRPALRKRAAVIEPRAPLSGHIRFPANR